MLFSLNVSVKKRQESGTVLVNETEYNCEQRDPPLQSPLLKGKGDCYSGAGLSQPLLPGAEPASPCSGFPLAPGALQHLGCSPLIHPDSAVALATPAHQRLNLRQGGKSGLEIPFCLISHRRGCVHADEFRKSVLSSMPGSRILSFPTKQDLSSSRPLSFHLVPWPGRAASRLVFFLFYNNPRSTEKLPIACRIPTYCPFCFLNVNILQTCGTFVETEGLTLRNNGTSDFIPFSQLSPLSLCAPRPQAGGHVTCSHCVCFLVCASLFALL